MDYRDYVGPAEKYDLMGAHQFNLLTALGLRDTHKVLDVGAGSLRLGRLLIPYLNNGNYYALEPNRALVQEGINAEVGVSPKDWTTNSNAWFNFEDFNTKFDYIIAQSIITHASAEQTRTIFHSARQYLTPNGIFLYTYIDGPPSYSKAKWTYPQTVMYPSNEMKMWEQIYEFVPAKLSPIASQLSREHPNKHTWRIVTWQTQGS